MSADLDGNRVGSSKQPPPAAAAMWNARYSEEGFAYGTEPNDFLAARAPKYLKSGSKVLAIAEGEGRNAVFLAEQLGCYVTGVDISDVGLHKVRQLAQERNVQTQVNTVLANLAEYDLGENEWDAIVGIYCHVPPPVRKRLLRDIPRALKPGGVVLMENYTPRQLKYKTGGPPSAELMYTKQMLMESLFGTSLDVEHCEELVRNVKEGKYHTGEASVVQLVARRLPSKTAHHNNTCLDKVTTTTPVEEVIRLHKFIETWLSGGEKADESTWSAFCDALDKDFEMVPPSGRASSKTAVMEAFRLQKGAIPGGRVEIRNARVMIEQVDLAVVRYEEWQFQSDESRKNARISTAMLRPCAEHSCGWKWVMLHETWLPEEEST